jgi:hypothetical protein
VPLTPPLLALLVLHQAAPAQPSPSDDAVAAAKAAERAAEAAERAAHAAEQSAIAVEALLHGQVPAPAVAAPAPAPAPAPAAAGAATPGTTPWTGTAGLSLIWLEGNANTLTFNATGSVSRHWTDWTLGVKGYATYGQATLPSATGSEVTALAAGGTLRGDRNVTNVVSLFLSGGASTDHVKSVEYVAFGDVGTGITWLEQKVDNYEHVYLRTDLSVHYEHEADFQYYPSDLDLGHRDLLGPRIAGAFRYALRKDVIFTQDAEVIPNILGTSRVRVNALTKLASRLTGSLSMTASFLLNYDSVPPAGKVPTDVALTVGLEMAI